MKRLRVYVGKADIESGVATSASFCPIARALSRRGMTHVSVGAHSAAFTTPDGESVHSGLPPAATGFVRDFDGGYLVTPFGFTLIPD